LGCDIGDWTHPTGHIVTDCDARLDSMQKTFACSCMDKLDIELIDSACVLENNKQSLPQLIVRDETEYVSMGESRILAMPQVSEQTCQMRY
jgi:hypothetical protein